MTQATQHVTPLHAVGHYQGALLALPLHQIRKHIVVTVIVIVIAVVTIVSRGAVLTAWVTRHRRCS